MHALMLDRKNTAGMKAAGYWHLKFYQHPHVLNMLALTPYSKRRRRWRMLSTLGTLTKGDEKVKLQCGQCEKDIKTLKNAK
jgi:hypothetical protein